MKAKCSEFLFISINFHFHKANATELRQRMKKLEEETDYKIRAMVEFMIRVYDTRIRDLETKFLGHLIDDKIKFCSLKYLL